MAEETQLVRLIRQPVQLGEDVHSLFNATQLYGEIRTLLGFNQPFEYEGIASWNRNPTISGHGPSLMGIPMTNNNWMPRNQRNYALTTHTSRSPDMVSFWGNLGGRAETHFWDGASRRMLSIHGSSVMARIDALAHIDALFASLVDDNFEVHNNCEVHELDVSNQYTVHELDVPNQCTHHTALCPICEEISTTHVHCIQNHMMCFSCYKSWARTHKYTAMSCPFCRTEHFDTMYMSCKIEEIK